MRKMIQRTEYLYHRLYQVSPAERAACSKTHLQVRTQGTEVSKYGHVSQVEKTRD